MPTFCSVGGSVGASVGLFGFTADPVGPGTGVTIGVVGLGTGSAVGTIDAVGGSVGAVGAVGAVGLSVTFCCVASVAFTFGKASFSLSANTGIAGTVLATIRPASKSDAIFLPTLENIKLSILIFLLCLIKI